jgi:hypothetical protein
MTEENQSTVPATEAKLTEQASATTPTAATPAETPAEELMIPKHRYDEVSRKLKALEDEAAKKAKEQQAEDEKKLAQQQEWQKLYEGRKAKVEELTPKAELADKLTEMVTQQYEAEIKNWPDTVKAMAPSADASILVKLDWANKARPLATELLADKTPTPGNGRRPQPVSPAGTGQREQQARAEQQRWTRNQF